jgi:hypothetical protein
MRGLSLKPSRFQPAVNTMLISAGITGVWIEPDIVPDADHSAHGFDGVHEG